METANSPAASPPTNTASDNPTAAPQALWLQPWIWLLAGLLLGLGILLLARCAGRPEAVSFWSPIEAIDLTQSRIDAALPAPTGAQIISQSFVPRRDGLTEVEVTLVRYGEADPTDTGTLTLRLHTADGTQIAAETLQTAFLNHNQVYRLRFDPQPDSAGQRYLLTLQGNEANRFTVWGYSLDVYGSGEVRVDDGPLASDPAPTAAADMRFQTRYRLTWATAATDLAETVFYEGALLLLALLVLPLPGLILLLVAARRGVITGTWDAAAWSGTAVALGVAVWPLVWQWLSAIGGRWWSWTLWLAVVLGWAAVTLLFLRRPQRSAAAQPVIDRPFTLAFHPEQLILLAILLIGLAVRLLAVRDVAFPLWVDASRHGLITAVMAESGQVIRSYAPFLPVDRFPYHYGFHALAATLRLLSGWPLERLLLYLGQLLGALVPLMMYTAVALVTQRRLGGLLAAFLIALPSFFPAYYTTWGRMTQLTAVLLLPVLLALTWQLVYGRAPWQKAWWLVGILAAGLFLVHFRVFVYYLPFAGLVWFLSSFRRAQSMLLAAALGVGLVLPRAWQLWRNTTLANKFSGDVSGFNEFPASYLDSGMDRTFAWVVLAAVVLVLIAAMARRRWALLPLTLAAWVASLFLLLAGDRFGLPETHLVTVSSFYILLFVPAGLLLGLLVDPLADWLHGRTPWIARATAVIIGMLVALLLVFGIRQQIDIVNEQTILAHYEDIPALEWAAGNLPPDALVAVNSWRWLGQTWAASDGGAWLVPLAGRLTTTPPIDHIYSADLWQFVRTFNEAATAVADWSDPAQAAWLREQGVTHIFVGKRGGFLDPAALSRNPALEMLYGRDGVFVFALAE